MPFFQMYAREVVKAGPSEAPTTSPLVVNAKGEARKVSGKRAEVLHACLPSPQESVKGCVVWQFRMANYLAVVINCTGVVSCEPPFPAQIAEVGRNAVLPEQGVIFHEIETGIRVKGCSQVPDEPTT